MTEPTGAREAATRLRVEAIRLGFTTIGFAPAHPPAHAAEYLGWLESGYHADMAWMARPDAVARRLDPRAALDGCRTIIVTALSYAPEPALEIVPSETTSDAPRYARGIDYHNWFEERLDGLVDVIREIDPEAGIKRYVDYGPVMERDHAQRAGLGWIGKNSMLINQELGSWLLLGELLTTLEIEPDEPFVPDRCGTCRACLEACPTDAILEGRLIDSARCISYLTIELRGSIPEELRPGIGTRVFGCDICQEACPWNTETPGGDSTALAMGAPVDHSSLAVWAERLLEMSVEDYREAYRGSPMSRPGRDAMLRNLCVGLGNGGNEDAIPVLSRCLTDGSELVREHAAWALARLQD